MLVDLVALVVIGGAFGVMAMLVLAAAREKPSGEPVRAPLAQRLAARYGRIPEAVPVDRRLSGQEAAAVQRLLDGALDRAAYQVLMAGVAAQDDLEHPLTVPNAPF